MDKTCVKLSDKKGKFGHAVDKFVYRFSQKPVPSDIYSLLISEFSFYEYVLQRPSSFVSRHTTCLLGGRRHVAWRDSVGVESSRLKLKSECADFSVLLRHSDEPQRGRNSRLQSRSVLSSFGVVLMSCKVNCHVVRSALQYSACRI